MESDSRFRYFCPISPINTILINPGSAVGRLNVPTVRILNSKSSQLV